MKNRIDKRFEDLSLKNQKAFISYITGGYPNKKRCIEIIRQMEESDVDIVEIGIPYSDPLADGPTIQRSSQVSLDNGCNIDTIFEIIKEIRTTSQIPLVIMSYYNSIYKYGIERFIKDLKHSSGDGIIIPDLPLEEREEFYNLAKKENIHLIPLVAMTSKDRIKKIVKNSGGFVYCISQNGVTGTTKELNLDVKELLDEVNLNSNLPTAIGFGIKDSESASYFSDFADGIICGSAFIERIENGDDIRVFAKEIKRAITKY